jgi:hypothetical protein
MSIRVAHLIPSLSRGGAGRALVALVGELTGVETTIVSLADVDVLMREKAVAAGALVLETEDALPALEAADIVQLHFWNTPELYALLRRGLPPVRLALWAHVAGDTPPQIVTRQLAELPDVFVATTPRTARLPVFDRAPRVIPAAPDIARIRRPASHAGFNVGYVGTVDFAKLNPRFVELCLAVGVPEARFVVCGSGEASRTIAMQVEQAGATERFELHGYVEEIGDVLSRLDVFGYPLAPGNYSTSDLALQEAMRAGIPPVVLPHGATSDLVRHGETGLVARDEDDYARSIEHLHANPEECVRLGQNACDEARRHSPAQVAREWSGVYAELMELPKRPRGWPLAAPARFAGAAAFVESLGESAPEFATSLNAGTDEEAAVAETLIAAAPPVLAAPAGGGILHYRRSYPGDGYLRLWAGLVLEASGRTALAALEFKQAAELGCDAPRVREHLARAAARAATR